MKTIRIYQAGKFEQGNAYPLDKASSNHLIKVLRLKNNYFFTLFNGDGYEYKTRLEITGKLATAHIESKIKTDNESSLNIHLFQGISKGERMDFAIQKAIELGVTSITPVVTERTVVNLKGDRQDKKLQHWRAVAISACEQSGRNYLPAINSVCQFKQCLTPADTAMNLLLDPMSTSNITDLNSTATHVNILIGPEGGLSDAEINQAKANAFKGIRLGPRILRTETAALAAIASVQLLWGDLGK